VAHEAPHYPLQGRDDAAVRVEGTENRGPNSPPNPEAVYREMVEVLDEGVGQVMDALERSGHLNDTFVFFCSDNGAAPPGSNGPLRGRKGTLFEGGHRVPAIASWPGTIKPGVTNETAMTMDLFPTLAELGARKAWTQMTTDGVSLAPLLKANKPLPERTLFWRTGGKQPEKAARRGVWKLHITPDATSLYDLEGELGEQANRFTSLPGQANALAMALSNWENEVAGVTPIA